MKIIKKLSIAWTLLIVVGSLLPSAFVKIQMMDAITGSDKLLHISMYAVASFLWMLGLHQDKVNRREKIFLLTGLCFLGFLLEILQMTITIGRFFEWYDALANCVGVVVGFFISYFYSAKKRNKKI